MYNLLSQSFAFLTCLSFCFAESFYLVTDKPEVMDFDKTRISYFNVTASRYGRRNHQYYTNIHIALDVPLDDNYTIEVVFYENVNNQFRRSFIEFHYKYCNFIYKDPVFGSAIRRQLDHNNCPTPKVHEKKDFLDQDFAVFDIGVYHLYNMTVAAESLPRLPFSKGRIYFHLKTKSKLVFKGYCGMELKKNKP